MRIEMKKAFPEKGKYVTIDAVSMNTVENSSPKAQRLSTPTPLISICQPRDEITIAKKRNTGRKKPVSDIF